MRDWDWDLMLTYLWLYLVILVFIAIMSAFGLYELIKIYELLG